MTLLRRKLFRDIAKSKWMFIAVILIVTLGIASYISLYSSYQNLNSSVENTYEELNFADFSVSIEPSPEKEVLEKIQAIEGISAVEGRIIVKAPMTFVYSDPKFISSRIISLPVNRSPKVNNVLVTEGTYFNDSSSDVVLVEVGFAKHHNITVGDFVYIKIGEVLRKFKIIGIVISPEYLWPAKSILEHMPDVLRRWGVLFMPKSLMAHYFNMSGLINEVSVITDGSKSLESITKEVEEVLSPYGVYDLVTRDEQPSNKIIRLMIDSLDALAIAFPVFFLIVAALSTYIIINRIVFLQKKQIGILLALGFPRRKLLFHYISFALTIGLIGSIVGSILGYFMSYPVTYLFATQISLPIVWIEFHPIPMIFGILVSLIFTGVAGFIPVWNTTKQEPLNLIHNKMTSNGRHLLIEKLFPFLSKLSNTWKMSYRNIFRNKKRSFFTAIGIALSLSMILVPAAFFDSMNASMDHYFNDIQLYDIKAVFSNPQNISILNEIESWNEIIKVEPLIEFSLRMKFDGGAKTIIVRGLPVNASLYKTYLISGKNFSENSSEIWLSMSLMEFMNENTTIELNLNPIVSEFWREMNRTRDRIYSNILSNISNIHSLIFGLSDNISEIHHQLYSIRNASLMAGFTLFDIPNLYISTWLYYVNTTYIPNYMNNSISIYQINSLTNQTAQIALLEQLNSLAIENATMIMQYYTLFATAWNSTFVEPYPSVESILNTPAPYVRGQEIIDEIIPTYLKTSELLKDIKSLYLLIYDYFNLTTWSQENVDSFVIDSIQNLFNITNDEVNFFVRVYNLSINATPSDFHELALNITLEQTSKENYDLIKSIYDLGENATKSDIEMLADEKTLQYINELLSERPPPNKSVKMNVAGYLDDPYGLVGFLPLKTAQDIFALDDMITSVLIKLSDNKQKELVKNKLYETYDILFIETTEEIIQDWNDMLKLYVGFIGTILLFGILIAFAIVFNTTMISVQERKREFATMRTFGFGTKRIVSIITIENMLILSVGILMGIPIANIFADYFLGLYSSEYFSFETIIFLSSYVYTLIGVSIVLLLSEIPGIRHIFKLSLAKVTKEIIS